MLFITNGKREQNYFFNREIIKYFAIKDEGRSLAKLENRLCVILSNCGMEEEQLATVQIIGITQLY